MITIIRVPPLELLDYWQKTGKKPSWVIQPK